MAESFAETTDGILLVANGFDPVLRWDGFTAIMETAGVVGPEATPTLSGSGAGPIVGTYYGYLRFVDSHNNVSNLSPISAVYEASGSTGTITGATNVTPIVITSSAHGLTTGTTVKITGVGGNTSANNTWSIIVIDPNTFSLTGSSGTADYTGGGTWTSGVLTVTFGNLEMPTDPKVVRRQLLRNTDGQADVFYVDIDTTDLSSASLSSTNDDTTLATGTAVPILDNQGAPIANSHYPPFDHKAVLCAHQDRMFAAVQYDYKQGNIKVTWGSTTVYGVGTEWMSTLAGRYLYVVGAGSSYIIDSVDVANQTLTLTTAYLDVSDNFAIYAIRPAPTEDRLVYYSLAGQPESWSPLNALSVQSDGDVLTGLMSKGSFIFFLERRHIYRFTFQSDPATDGAVFLSANRGCINHRCWIDVEGTAYMLDFEGIHSFDGGQEIQPVGAPVQQAFRPGEIAPYKINWAASQYFHALLFATQQTIRWFVALSGNDLPHHAIAFNYRIGRWWIESFRFAIGAACAGYIGGIPRVFLGSSARKVFAYWEGYLDGPNPSLGTVRGTVTSSTITSFTDTAAAFASAGLVGSPVAIVDGTGKGQVRIVVSVVGTTVNLNQPWQVLPDTTSIYQLGGIDWRYRSSWFPWVEDENYNERRFQLVFQTTIEDATLDMRLLRDFSDVGLVWATNVSSDQGDGVRCDANKKDLVVDLTKTNGVVQKRFGGQRELYTTGTRYGQVELAGFSNSDQVAVYQIAFDGVTKSGGG